METEFLRIKELNLIIYKDNNEYTIHQDVDFNKYPYRNRKKSLSIKIEKEELVLKTFFDNGIIELKPYIRNLLNEKIELFLGLNKNQITMISSNKKYLECSKCITGVETIISSFFEVIEVYNEINLFKEQERKEGVIYGLFEVEKNSFSCLQEHPLTVLVSFADFGKRELRKGSLFIKLKEIK